MIIRNRFKPICGMQIKTAVANMGNVQFPVRMGDLANLDDGLVAYLIEATGEDPYSTVYAPAAPAGCRQRPFPPSPAHPAAAPPRPP